MKRKEDRSRASLQPAASERKPLKINSEKGKRNEGRRGVLRTESRPFWLGMGARETRSPHPHMDTMAPGGGGPQRPPRLHPSASLRSECVSSGSCSARSPPPTHSSSNV